MDTNKLKLNMLGNERCCNSHTSRTTAACDSGKQNKYMQNSSCCTLPEGNGCRRMRNMVTQEQYLANMLSSQVGDDSMLSFIRYKSSQLSNDLYAITGNYRTDDYSGKVIKNK